MRKVFEVRVSTTTGLVVIGAVLALFVGFVVWTLAGQADSDKAFAANVLTSLVDAQRRHRERHGRYAPDLDALGDPWSTRSYTNYNGYTHEVLPPPGEPTSTWAARATPRQSSWPHFYVDHSGVVRFEERRPAGPESPRWVRRDE